MTLNELKAAVDFEKFIVSLGYTLDKKRSTKRNPVYENNGDKIRLKHGDKYTVYVSINKPDNGTIIDFCQARENEVLANCQGSNILEKTYNRLMDFLGRQHEIRITGQQMSREPKKDFSLDDETYINPVKKDINSQGFNYLKRRGIFENILSSPVFTNIGLSKNSYGYYNLAFPLFNREDEIKAVGCRYYNPTSKKNVKIFTEGSDKLHSIGLSTLDYKNASEVIICESDIDCMSHYQLHRNSRQDLLYIACEGYLTKEQIKNILSHIETIEKYQGTTPRITTAFDKDESGLAYSAGIQLSLAEGEAIPISPDLIQRGNENIKAFSFVISMDTISNNYCQLLEDVPGIRINFVNNQFKITVPRTMESLISINKALLTINTNIQINLPISKDFNEDLQNSLEVIKKKRIDRSGEKYE